MQEIFDIYTLDFIRNTDIIEEIKDGYSGALLYKITRNKSKFFIKIFKERLTFQKIEKIKNSILIYKKLNIKSLDIITFGKIDNLDMFYIVYNFIEGTNLKVYTNTGEYSLEDIRKIGEKVGKEFLKLKNYEDYNNQLFIYENIDEAVESTINNFNLLLRKEFYKDILLKYFNIEELNQLKNQLIEYSIMLKDCKPKLIHGDIKRSNIMINGNKDLYIVDIESMQVNYDVLNFKYQITWCLFEGNKKEAEFVKGYFDGIYNGKRPQNFNYKIFFTIILNFFTESFNLYKKSDIAELEIYVQKCRALFDTINKLNIEKEFII